MFNFLDINFNGERWVFWVLPPRILLCVQEDIFALFFSVVVVVVGQIEDTLRHGMGLFQ